MTSKSQIIFGVLLCTSLALIQASPLPAKHTDSATVLMDSPKHVIQTLNPRMLKDPGTPIPVHGSSRSAKSGEDGPVTYVVIQPAEVKAAPVVRKYRSDNSQIYMAGVQSRSPRLNLAPGAYPVYYSVAAANGKFGRNIRALTKEEIRLAEEAARLAAVQE